MKNGEKERLINGNRWILGRKKQRIEEILKDGKSDDNVNRMKEKNCSGGEGKKPKEMIRRKRRRRNKYKYSRREKSEGGKTAWGENC